MNKWEGVKVSYEAVLVGLLFNTRNMTVGITDTYRKEVLDLINDRWHSYRKAFTVSDIEKFAGKLGRLGEGARWSFHLMSETTFRDSTKKYLAEVKTDLWNYIFSHDTP